MTQEEALNILKTGANVFLTGEPGSGKTHTINEYVAFLRASGVEPSITASTGIAATHIGGQTVHSWSGIGIRTRLSPYDLDNISSNKRIVENISSAKVLIVDEVSMLSAGTLSMVDAVCREIKRRDDAFGGIQVIFIGDFFQLPPIKKVIESEETINYDEELFDTPRSEFAFGSSAWDRAKPLVCYLSEQHRQDDKELLSCLSAIRNGNVNDFHKELLTKKISKNPEEGVIKLYTHNADVDRMNASELSKLPGTAKSFIMESRGKDSMVDALKRGCLSPENLSLKIGARVMFTKNDPARRFVNGTLGVVADFSKTTGYPIVRVGGRTIEAEPAEWRMEDAGSVLARVTQIPLRLAWTITVHKSQGMSLDAAHMDLGNTFEYGQGYVALSRVRTFEGLTLGGMNKRAFEVHPEIRSKDKEFKAASLATREVFENMDKEEIESLHKNFVEACGGKIGQMIEKKDQTESKIKVSTNEKTLELVLKGLNADEMAEARGVTKGTIIAHLENLKKDGKVIPERDLMHLRPEKKRFKEISLAFSKAESKSGSKALTPVRELLGEKYSFDELRLARLFLSL